MERRWHSENLVQRTDSLTKLDKVASVLNTTVKDLNVVVNDLFHKGSSHFDQFWTYLPKPECLFLSLLAENIREYESFISLDRVRKFCKGWFAPGIDIYKIISQLQEKDLIIRRDYMGKPHIGFFMDLFKQWILIHHPSDSYE